MGEPLVSNSKNPRSFSPHILVAGESLPLFLPVVASDATLCADFSIQSPHWLLSTGSLLLTEGISLAQSGLCIGPLS